MYSKNAPVQWTIVLEINAPAETVWDIADDISAIPKYHPEVESVELISGHKNRTLGAKYRCSILKGRTGSCVEEVVEYVAGHRMSVSFPEDTWGLSTMLGDFVVVTTLFSRGPDLSEVRLEAHYEPIGIRMRLVNFLGLRRVMKKRAMNTLLGLKRLAEATK